MKITISHDRWDRIYGLGISCWFPRHTCWKRFNITLTVGPFFTEITFGNRAQFDAELILLRGNK